MLCGTCFPFYAPSGKLVGEFAEKWEEATVNGGKVVEFAMRGEVSEIRAACVRWWLTSPIFKPF